jgi:hypothetical protein
LYILGSSMSVFLFHRKHSYKEHIRYSIYNPAPGGGKLRKLFLRQLKREKVPYKNKYLFKGTKLNLSCLSTLDKESCAVYGYNQKGSSYRKREI